MRSLTLKMGISPRLGDVMKSVKCVAQFFVELYHDFLCHAGDGRNVTYTGADDGRSVILNVGNLDYCKVKITEKSVAQFLSRFREMEVEVVGVV